MASGLSSANDAPAPLGSVVFPSPGDFGVGVTSDMMYYSPNPLRQSCALSDLTLRSHPRVSKGWVCMPASAFALSDQGPAINTK